jgi:hypothetical protein
LPLPFKNYKISAERLTNYKLTLFKLLTLSTFRVLCDLSYKFN